MEVITIKKPAFVTAAITENGLNNEISEVVETVSKQTTKIARSVDEEVRLLFSLERITADKRTASLRHVDSRCKSCAHPLHSGAIPLWPSSSYSHQRALLTLLTSQHLPNQ